MCPVRSIHPLRVSILILLELEDEDSGQSHPFFVWRGVSILILLELEDEGIIRIATQIAIDEFQSSFCWS